MKTPVLETARLTLRPFRQDDAQNVLVTWESDREVAKYLPKMLCQGKVNSFTVDNRPFVSYNMGGTL